MLELRNVFYKYDSSTKTVLNDINVSFNKGKLYCIIGKSGSGKTTLLSLVSGLDKTTEGEICYEGQNIARIDRDRYRAKSIGVIFQSYNLLTNVTAVDNVVLSMQISGSKEKGKKELAYKLLENIGIDKETADRKVLKLSGGEQQRVGIARVLSHTPDIIIADEPTGNLDSETEASIMRILTDLAHKENKCVIIVTHSKEVAKYADEVINIQKGYLS